MKQALHIDVPLQPKQRMLWETYNKSVARRVAYGGSRGGAKSHGMRAVLLRRRFEYPKTNGIILRRVHTELVENHIIPFFDQFPQLERYYTKNDQSLSLPNGSYLRFASAENYTDLKRFFQGPEWADIGVDEATQFEGREIDKLTQSNRCTKNRLIVPKMLLTMNPGGIGHAYIKRLFVSRKFEANEDPNDYAYIQAYAWDNVEWVRQYLDKNQKTVADYYAMSDSERFEIFTHFSDYGRTLNALPEVERKAMLLGDWDIFAGQFFPMWSSKTHVVQGYQFKNIENVRGALDYGQRTVLEVGERDYEGNITIGNECYTEFQTPSERANRIADFLLENQLHGIQIVYDTNMEINLRDYTGYDKTPIAIFREVFRQRMGDREPRLRVVSKASPDNRGYRQVCNEAVKEYLTPRRVIRDDGTIGTGQPRLKVDSRCIHLIETLPELIYPENDPTGLDFDQRVGIDDPFDAMKYLVMELYIPIRQDEDGRPSWAKKMFGDVPPEPTEAEVNYSLESEKGWQPGER